MAQSRSSQNGPDWMDVTRAAQEFAQQWGGFVAIVMRPAGTQKFPTLTLVASLYAELRDVGVAKPLVSASVSMPGNGVGDMSAAALLALYELDKQVYREQIGISPIRR